MTHFTTTQGCTFILVILKAILNEQTDARLLRKETANYIYDACYEHAKKLGLIPLVLIPLLVVVPTTAFASVDNDTTDSVQIVNPESPRMLEDQSVLNLNITYWNKTQAILNNTVLNFALSDEIIQFINEKIAEENEGRLEEAEPAEEEKESIEEQEDESGSGSGNDGDGGGDNNDEPLPCDTCITPIPNPEEPEPIPEPGDDTGEA